MTHDGESDVSGRRHRYKSMRVRVRDWEHMHKCTNWQTQTCHCRPKRTLEKSEAQPLSMTVARCSLFGLNSDWTEDRPRLDRIGPNEFIQFTVHKFFLFGLRSGPLVHRSGPRTE